MADFLAMVATLREQMQAELTRTDALRPLIWPVGGLLLALTTAIAFKAPGWLLVTLAGAAGVMLLAYLCSYGFFAIKDPDALRSEKYILHKMAIEHGLIGNSQIGLHKVDDLPPDTKAIDALPSPGGSNG